MDRWMTTAFGYWCSDFMTQGTRVVVLRRHSVFNVELHLCMEQTPKVRTFVLLCSATTISRRM